MLGTESGSGAEDLEKKLQNASGDRERAAVLADLAWSVKYSSPSRAITLADRAIELSQETGFEQNLPKCYMARAMGLMHMSRFKTAESAAHAGLEVYRRLGNEAGVRHALNVTGSIYFRWGRYTSALQNFTEALRVHEKISSQPDPGILSNIGAVHLQLGDTEMALECYARVYEMAGGMDGPSDLKTAALINMGEIYGRMGMNEAALESLDLARSIADAGDMKQALAVIDDNTGSVMTALERYDDAMVHYRRSVELFRTLEDVKGEALVLCSMGKCLLEQGDERAMEMYQESHRLFRSLNDSRGASETLTGTARVMASRGMGRDALEILAEALEIAGNKGLKPQLSEIHLLLSGIFESSGDYEKALMHLQLHHEIDGQLRSERVDNRLRSLRVIHQVEQARREAALYRVRNLKLEEEKQRPEGTVPVRQEGFSSNFCANGTAGDPGGTLDIELELDLLLERVHGTAGDIGELLTLAVESSEAVLEEGSLSQDAHARLERVLDSIRSAFPLVKHLSGIKGSDDEINDPVTDISSFLEYRSPEGFSTEKVILVVEDDPEIARLLITVFEANDYPVAVASSVRSSREILETHLQKMGCVFVDVMLPDGSGIDLLREIRARASGLPLLAGSGYPLSGKDMQYLRENRITFIQKPYNIDTLMLCISTMLPM